MKIKISRKRVKQSKAQCSYIRSDPKVSAQKQLPEVFYKKGDCNSIKKESLSGTGNIL